MPDSTSMMALGQIFGGKTAAATLLYLEMYEKCYSKQIADNFRCSPSMVQKQLDKFEGIGVVVFERIGNIKMYSFNSKSTVGTGLKDVLSKALASLDEQDFITYFNERKRPRRPGKPLWINQETIK